jgi:penicillin-binding protein 1C
MQLEEVVVCKQSGYRKGIYCNDSETILTPQNDQEGVCPYCIIVHLDKKMQWQVSTDCESISNMQSRNWFVLPPHIEWYYRQYHSDYRPLPPFMPGCFEENNYPLSVIYPHQNSKIFIPVEIDGRLGKTIFEATHRDPDMKLYWHLDESYLGDTIDIHQVAVAPEPGIHILTVVDENGKYLQRTFEIIAGH